MENIYPGLGAQSPKNRRSNLEDLYGYPPAPSLEKKEVRNENRDDSWVSKTNFLDQVAAAAHEKYGVSSGVSSDRTGYFPSPAFSSTVDGTARSSYSDLPTYSQSPVYFDRKTENGPVKGKRPVLVGTPPVGAQTYSMPAQPTSTMGISSQMPYGAQTAFGLGVGKYGNEIPSPLDSEIQHTILEMQQELAFIETQPTAPNLRHSKRLLKERCAKLENTVDPDWVEVDINKPIKVTKRVLIPTFRHATFNYVGRILGPKGQTLQNICKKFKCFISIMGAGSTKDRAREMELLNSNDPRFAHYASPLHIRIDTVAAAHIAHMRMAACLNVFHKLLIPGKEVYIEGITTATDKPQGDSWVKPSNKPSEYDDKEEDDLEQDFNFGMEKHRGGENEVEEEHHEDMTNGSNGGGGPMKSRPSGRGVSSSRGRGGGFVPRGRGGGFVAKGTAPY